MSVNVLTVDVGTTGVKAGVFNGDGVRLGIGRAAQEILSRNKGWREHDPATTWDAVCRAVRETIEINSVDGQAVGAVVVTGPRGTFAGIGADGRPTTHFLTWQDRRAGGPQQQEFAGDAYADITGAPFDPSMVVPKLLWLRDNEPECVAKTVMIATPQSYVLSELGAPDAVVDYSTAAHFGLFDVRCCSWSDELLDESAIPREWMPIAVEPGAVVGSLSRAAAEKLGLASGIDLVAAGSDGVCSELGAGVVAEGSVYAYLGTATAVAGPALKPTRVAPALILMPGAVRGRWRVLALGMAGASVVDWFARATGASTVKSLEAVVAHAEPGANGVRFMPTLAGAGAPFWHGDATGAFLGLTLSTSADDLARAVVEGIALEMRWMIDAIRAIGIDPDLVTLTGGGSQLDSFAQVIADVTQQPIARVRDPETGLLGAAFYGFAVSGRLKSPLDGAVEFPAPSDRFQPNESLAGRYTDAADGYGDVRCAFAERGLDRLLSIANRKTG